LKEFANHIHLVKTGISRARRYPCVKMILNVI